MEIFFIWEMKKPEIFFIWEIKKLKIFFTRETHHNTRTDIQPSHGSVQLEEVWQLVLTRCIAQILYQGICVWKTLRHIHPPWHHLPFFFLRFSFFLGEAYWSQQSHFFLISNVNSMQILFLHTVLSKITIAQCFHSLILWQNSSL